MMTLNQYLGQSVMYQAPHTGTPAVQISDMTQAERRLATQWMMSRAEEIKAACLAVKINENDIPFILTIIGTDAKTLVSRSTLYRALGSL